MKGQVSLRHWCFVGKGWDRRAAFGAAPTRCLRARGEKEEKEWSTVASLFAREPFPGHSPRFLAGEREGGKAEGGASEQEQCEKRGEGKWG